MSCAQNETIGNTCSFIITSKKGHLVLEDCGSGNVAHEASRNVSEL